ncbi:hypothetical protein ACFW2V_12160 [Streptomyces sp. NPDC058947]|uniref:hypothetical protein n=1 Tax=Streptomyces sp. NPDC058947 TaxID=3346675 RepID=UPI0036B72A4D
MDANAVDKTLAQPGASELVLFVGPNYEQMQARADMAGFETRRASRTEDAQALKARIAASGRSLILLASAPEVEGRLDRSSFGPDLVHLVYDADRVVYFGIESSVVIHPLPSRTRLEVRHGALRIHQEAAVVHPGRDMVGLSLNSQ